jgi:sugar phosphate isomerase/epimerase
MAKPVAGAQLYTVRKSTQTLEDLETTYQKVKDIGYTEVQMSAWGKELDPEDIARLLEKYQLKVAITHLGWNLFQEDLDKVIAIHKAWNAKHTAIGGAGQYFKEGGVAEFLKDLDPIADRLAAEGLDFSYHNHSAELARYSSERTWLAELIEDGDPAKLKLELDTFWVAMGGGDPAQWVRKCKGRIPCVHFKDMTITPEKEHRMAEIGQGNLNWPEIIQACEEAGVESGLVEQDNCYGRDPFESLKISYDFLKGQGCR